MKNASRFGYTWVEFVVVLCVLAVLGALLLPIARHFWWRSQMTNALHQMRSLALVTQQMALDHNPPERDATNSGWPGDFDGTFTNWTAQLLRGDYLSTNDLCKLLSAPGRTLPPGHVPTPAGSAFLVYAVSSNSPANTVFLSSANFTNTPTGGVLNPTAPPFAEHGFVVVWRGGDGLVLKARDAGDTNAVGAYAPLCH